MKRAIVSVINDLSTDQRVHKVCMTLQTMGFDVLLIGRRQRKSLPLFERPYKTKRMFLFFEKGPLFYFEFQLRLFFNLLTHKADVLIANDLDTLMPNYVCSKLKKAGLVYDSHELFCEVPELQTSRTKKRIWKRMEQWIFPKLDTIFTVNDSIAKLYGDEYKKKLLVVRNVPFLSSQKNIEMADKTTLGIPADKKIIVLQGAGINIDRGAEEAVEAMKYIDNAILLIIGSGDVLDILKQMAVDMKITDKVKFVGKIPFERLVQYTRHADLGLTLDKDTNVNYRYSLPNKLFDYIHAAVPVLASNLVEIRKIIDDYQIGDTINNHDPKLIADKIITILDDESTLLMWKKNTKIAAEKLNWEVEQETLKNAYAKFLGE